MKAEAHKLTCWDIQERLVPFQDGELAPSELELVAEHLDGCDGCADLERRLDRATPRPTLLIPPRVHEELQHRVAEAVDRAWETTTWEPPTLTQRWRRWLARDRDVTTSTMLAYAAMLLVVSTWGMGNWMEARQLRAQATDPGPSLVSPIPAEQYRPASYAPTPD
jgi:hypothetical protein